MPTPMQVATRSCSTSPAPARTPSPGLRPSDHHRHGHHRCHHAVRICSRIPRYHARWNGAGAEASGFVLQASNSTITGFRIQNFINGTTSITGTGIVIDGTTGGGDNNTISQNYLTNNSESVTGSVGAISITGAADNNLITDNQLINNNSDGIRFADALSTGSQITNNVITGSGDDGVKLVGANITFTGNTVSNSQRLSATSGWSRTRHCQRHERRFEQYDHQRRHPRHRRRCVDR